MNRRVALVLAGSLTMVSALVGGCSRIEEAVPVSGAVLAISPTQFEVTVGCFDSVRVEVDEETDRVELLAYGKGRIGGDCASTAIVSLAAPLGDRSVVDGKTGRTVPVTPPEG
ncbi:MAG: hypothetical protein ABL966_09385 [Acidimicrobiales bacterium]